MNGHPALENIIEAILFASDKPVSVESLAEALPDATARGIEAALRQLSAFYDEAGRSFVIRHMAGGYRMVTRPEFHPYLQSAFRDRRKWTLSRAALETLAIVALKEPVIVPDVERIRGVSSSGVMKKLLELKLVRALGRKEVVGRPILYGVAETFYDHFGLRDRKHLYDLIQNLPSVEDEGSDHVTIIGPPEESPQGNA